MFGKRTVQAYLAIVGIGLFSVLVVLVMARKPSFEALIAGTVAVLVVAYPLIWLGRKLGYPIGQPVHCARCGTEQPAMRRPANARQALLGGYTCAKCGAELDARGRERQPSA
jgi:DNA-directed RNA polymerase subunit RPC12/RpoP